MQDITGELAALGTSMCFAFGSTLFTFAGRELGAQRVNRVRLLLAAILIALVHWLLLGRLFPSDVPVDTVGWLMLSGVVGLVLGDVFLLQAFVLDRSAPLHVDDGARADVQHRDRVGVPARDAGRTAVDRYRAGDRRGGGGGRRAAASGTFQRRRDRTQLPDRAAVCIGRVAGTGGRHRALEIGAGRRDRAAVGFADPLGGGGGGDLGAGTAARSAWRDDPRAAGETERGAAPDRGHASPVR